MKTIRKILRSLILLLGMLVVGIIFWRYTHKNTVSVNFGSVPDFSLTDQTGTAITLQSLHGNFWVASFIFTRCMGPCPLISVKMAELQKEFKPERHLKFISFSVDPVHDTPEVLSKYAVSFGAENARWHFLSGDKKIIYSLIRDGFKLAADEVPAPEKKGSPSDFIHSTLLVVVDKDARIRGFYNSTDQEALERLRSDLKKWM